MHGNSMFVKTVPLRYRSIAGLGSPGLVIALANDFFVKLL